MGAAVDITYNAAHLPRELSDEVLAAAGVDLPDGARVVDYERAQSPSRGKFRNLANPDDYWQFCLMAADGSWVTYGDTTGVQDFSGEGTDPCTFTGRHHRGAPTDVRLAAHATADVANGEVFVEKAQGPDGDELLRDLVTDRLPGSWQVSDVDRRGIAYQYCVTTPDADWFLIQGRFVVQYGSSGNCRTDPDMAPEH